MYPNQRAQAYEGMGATPASYANMANACSAPVEPASGADEVARLAADIQNHAERVLAILEKRLARVMHPAPPEMPAVAKEPPPPSIAPLFYDIRCPLRNTTDVLRAIEGLVARLDI